MTFWAKLLTFILVVLSLVFAAISGVVFTKRQELRVQLVNLKAQYDSDTTKLKAERDEAQHTIKVQVTENAKLATERDSLIQTTETLTSESNERLTQLTEMKKHWDAFEDVLRKNTADFRIVAIHNEELVTANSDLRKENMKYMTNLANAESNISSLRKDKSDLEDQVDSLKTNLATANKTLTWQAEVFAELKKQNIKARGIIDAIQPVPRIKARVVLVNPKTKSVVLNVGKDDGVKETYDFTLYREGEFVAKISIFALDAKQCVGRVTTPNLPIQQGDSATTRLP